MGRDEDGLFAFASLGYTPIICSSSHSPIDKRFWVNEYFTNIEDSFSKKCAACSIVVVLTSTTFVIFYFSTHVMYSMPDDFSWSKVHNPNSCLAPRSNCYLFHNKNPSRKYVFPVAPTNNENAISYYGNVRLTNEKP